MSSFRMLYKPPEASLMGRLTHPQTNRVDPRARLELYLRMVFVRWCSSRDMNDVRLKMKNMPRRTAVSPATREELTEKCQENGWLRRGGYAWQDDPYLEEYPYSFVQTDDLDDLATFLKEGNWSLRSGIVYEDLAFIQQDDGGDEWWTLKRFDEGWLDFESISCAHIIRRDPAEFRTMVAAMGIANAQQCQQLEYMESAKLIDGLVDLAKEHDFYEIADSHDNNLEADISHALINQPEKVITYLEELKIVYGVKGVEDLIEQVRLLPSQMRNRTTGSLEEKAATATEVSESLTHTLNEKTVGMDRS